MCFFPICHVEDLQCVEIELLATVGWSGAASLSAADVCKMWRTAETRLVRHVCLRNPFWGIPSIEVPQSRREAEGLVAELWSPGLVKEYSDLRCFYVTTAKEWIVLVIELSDHGGLEMCLPAFQLAKCDFCRCQEETCFICLFRLRNLNLHSLPVAWCFWEQVFYSLPPPVHHGDSFAAKKELPSPLLSPRIIFAHRIQSSAGRIWPLIERFDRCAAVPCDSALIRWRILLALVPWKIQFVAEFDGPTAGFHLFVKVPDSWRRIKDHLQARWDILQCDSSEIVIVIVGFLVAPLKPKGSPEQISLLVFVGSFESFNVGDYFLS